jgi:hypothetical protein
MQECFTFQSRRAYERMRAQKILELMKRESENDCTALTACTRAIVELAQYSQMLKLDFRPHKRILSFRRDAPQSQ